MKLNPRYVWEVFTCAICGEERKRQVGRKNDICYPCVKKDARLFKRYFNPFNWKKENPTE